MWTYLEWNSVASLRKSKPGWVSTTSWSGHDVGDDGDNGKNGDDSDLGDNGDNGDDGDDGDNGDDSDDGDGGDVGVQFAHETGLPWDNVEGKHLYQWNHILWYKVGPRAPWEKVI